MQPAKESRTEEDEETVFSPALLPPKDRENKQEETSRKRGVGEGGADSSSSSVRDYLLAAGAQSPKLGVQRQTERYE